MGNEQNPITDGDSENGNEADHRPERNVTAGQQDGGNSARTGQRNAEHYGESKARRAKIGVQHDEDCSQCRSAQEQQSLPGFRSCLVLAAEFDMITRRQTGRGRLYLPLNISNHTGNVASFGVACDMKPPTGCFPIDDVGGIFEAERNCLT